tara:strand:+ start:115 stop:498 length:384 start_codon:yes stop_codon:yes gene_type:complete
MTTQITGRWETIIKLIKFENKAKEVLEKHLKDNKLSELPEPEWTENDPTMAYIYLPTRSLNGKDVRYDKTRARMFPESIVGYLEKGGLMKLPAKVEASKTKEQLPKMETEKPILDKLEKKIGDLKDE